LFPYVYTRPTETAKKYDLLKGWKKRLLFGRSEVTSQFHTIYRGLRKVSASLTCVRLGATTYCSEFHAESLRGNLTLL